MPRGRRLLREGVPIGRSYTHANSYSYGDCHSHSNRYSHGNCYADGYCNCYSDGHTHVDAETVANGTTWTIDKAASHASAKAVGPSQAWPRRSPASEARREGGSSVRSDT